MYPDDYGNFEIISKTPGDGVTCESIRLKYRGELTYCPFCDSRDFAKHDAKAPRRVRDVYESGKTVLLKFDNKRYQCRNCEKEFNPNRYPSCIPEKARVSTSCLSEIADYTIEYLGMTHKEIATVFGVSPPVVSQALHDRMETTEIKFISSLKPTKLLFVYPFKYGRKLRYAVCGTDFNDNTYLYDLRSDYEPEDVKLYFDRIRFQSDEVPWATFIDFDEDVVGILRAAKSLRSIDGDIPELGIMKQLFIRKVDEFRTSKADKIGKTIDGDLNYLLMSLFVLNETTEESFLDILYEWYNYLSDENEQRNKAIKDHLHPLYLLLDYFCPLSALTFAYSPKEMEIDKYLNFISTFKRHNTPFEEMRYRIMMHAENYENIPMQKLMNSGYDGLGVRDMRIDLRKINAIYNDKWNPTDDGNIDEYPEFYKS